MPQTTSSTQPRFDYQRFLSLSDSDLVAYMEPMLNDSGAVVEPKDLRSLAADLASFDEYHVVYAIELGTDRLPSVFACAAAGRLKHRDQSVRLAAHRALSRLPAQEITEDLIAVARAAVAGAPPSEVGDLPNILERRRQTETGIGSHADYSMGFVFAAAKDVSEAAGRGALTGVFLSMMVLISWKWYSNRKQR